MATDPSGIIANLLAGTGYGRTVGDYQQQNIQNQLGQQQLATSALQGMAVQQKLQQQARWQAWSADYAKDPSPQKLAQGVAMFPDQADALQKSYQIMDEPARISRVTQLSQIYNAAKGGRADLASQQIDGIINAEKQQGIDTSEAEGIKASLAAGDKSALTQLQAFAQAHLAAASPEFAKAIGLGNDQDNHFTVSGDYAIDQRTGQARRFRDTPPEYQWDADRGAFFLKPGTGGGDLASSGGAAAGSGGDVSRLINSDAGGGYVPDSVKNLGQFVAFGKSLNAKGAKSSSAGTYQINGSTMAQFAPKVFGDNWKATPFDADAQERVGEAIFDWAKQQKNPAAALKSRWVSLSSQDAANLVKGDWQQARSKIAQGETGGGAGASANRGGLPQSVQVAPAKQGYSILTPQEVSAIPGLDPQTVYQRSPTGEISAVGGQNKSQLKPLPPKALDVLSTNNASLQNINQAISLLDPSNKSKSAQAARYSIGSSNYLIPNAILQHTDENGNQFRAQIGQIGGVIIKDISGAAVSASEDERLAKWVPSVTDSPSAALAKLKNLRREIMQRNSAVTDAYSEEQGYRPYTGGQQPQAASGFRILRVRPK